MPSPTPTPGLSLEEIAYLIEVVAILDDYTSAFQNVSALMAIVTEDPLILLDDDWILQMAMQLAAVNVCGFRIGELEPPPRFQLAHQDVIEAAQHFGQATELLAEGVDELNLAKIEKATEEMLLGNECIRRATAKFEELQ